MLSLFQVIVLGLFWKQNHVYIKAELLYFQTGQEHTLLRGQFTG